MSASKSGKKLRCEAKDIAGVLKVEGLRSRGNKTSIQAAIELRAKRDTLQVTSMIPVCEQRDALRDVACV